MKTETISIRVSSTTKYKAQQVFKSLGITTSSAINMFLKQAIKEQKLPFNPTVKACDKK